MAFDFTHEAFTTDDFSGKDALWTPAGGAQTTVRVTFSLGVEDVNLGADIVPQSAIAQAGCKSADMAGIKQKDSLVIDGVTYHVLKIHPDETGWSTLFLGKAY